MEKTDSHRRLERQSERSRSFAAHRLETAFLLPPFAFLSLVVIVISCSIVRTHHDSQHVEKIAFLQTAHMQQLSDESPNLHTLVADIADAFDKANVTYWLLPGLGLLPPSDASPGSSSIGRINPWQEGVDIGVYQDDLMRVIEAQAELQVDGIIPVESYFGLRLFHNLGFFDDRYDFRTPFVDVLYFKTDSEHVVNYCCDCAPIAISACTKKMCGCLVCASAQNMLFPLSEVKIDGMRRTLPGPNDASSLLLPRELENVHPAVFSMQ